MTKSNYHSITGILELQNSVSIPVLSSRFNEKWKQKGFYISFCIRNRIERYHIVQEWCDLKQK